MKHLKTLLKLKEQKELNYSQVPKNLIEELKSENLIEIKIISANKKKIIVKEQFYTKYKDLEEIEKATSRSELVKTNSHTKAKKISPQDGLYINGNCMIEDVKLPLFPPSKSSALFLKEFPTISKDILVVGVENFENLIYFKSQLKYFQDNNILFVYRNSAMLRFIANIENEVIYFGDFDLAGIHIYLYEICKFNKNVKLFIPQNIEELIKNNGSSELYKKQFSKYKDLNSKNGIIQYLIDIINKNQRSLEQEYFI